MKTDLNIAPFHKVGMSSYLSDSRYESVMVPFCKFASEYCQNFIINSADKIEINNNDLTYLLAKLEDIVSIEGHCHMYLNRDLSGCADFSLPMWFLISLLQEECKQGAIDDIPFTMQLIAECR